MNQQTQPQLNQTQKLPPEDLIQFINITENAIRWAHKNKNAPPHITDETTLDIIAIGFGVLGFKRWKKRFQDGQEIAARLCKEPDNYYRTIQMAISTPEVQRECLRLHPELDTQKYFGNGTAPLSSDQITPRPAPTATLNRAPIKSTSKTTNQKTVSVAEHILKHAPSKSYELLYSTVLAHTKNRFSSRGKKVYIYGREYAVKKTGLKSRTLDRAWAWLKKCGIFNKAFNENKDAKQTAHWFICTSLKQIGYYRDPKNRHLKTNPTN